MCEKNQCGIKTLGYLESPRFVHPLLRAKREAWKQFSSTKYLERSESPRSNDRSANWKNDSFSASRFGRGNWWIYHCFLAIV